MKSQNITANGYIDGTANNGQEKADGKELKAAKNIQRFSFQLTQNNPLDYDITHLEIKKRLIENFPTLKYFCLADEIGEKGTPHTHIFVCFGSRVRFSKLKRHFPEAHIEPAKGTVESNIDYIRKSGRWEDSEKAETRVDGTFEEWGTPPRQKGKKQEMEELYQLVDAGLTNSQIIAINNDYILHIDKIDKLRLTLLTDKYKDIRRLNLKVVYVYGATGKGKTRHILDENGDSNVYRVTDYKHPFDSYCTQPVLVFEEFRNALRISDMLDYLDIYPLELPARYANKYACYETVYIISNWELEKQYSEVQTDSPETWKAFLRRIHEVRVYQEDGSIIVYDSVEKYLRRNEEFHEPSHIEQTELPF